MSPLILTRVVRNSKAKQDLSKQASVLHPFHRLNVEALAGMLQQIWDATCILVAMKHISIVGQQPKIPWQTFSIFVITMADYGCTTVAQRR